jgi:hypothetical protein
MQLAGSLLAIYILAGVNGVFGTDWPLRGWVRLLIYLYVSFSLWRLYVTLRRIQQSDTILPANPHEDKRGMASESGKAAELSKDTDASYQDQRGNHG